MSQLDNQNSQKFIGKERAPRVQIEYEVEVYGSQKKVELPFVVGVMSDLSGDRKENLGSVEDRSFLDMDMDNFDERMKAINPSAQFHVEDKLRDNGKLMDVDLTFDSIVDFEPDQIARRIPELNQLLEARQHLSELITYMDGKASAENVVEQLLNDPGSFSEMAKNPEVYMDKFTNEIVDEPSTAGRTKKAAGSGAAGKRKTPTTRKRTKEAVDDSDAESTESTE